MNIIQCYAPTNDYNEDPKDQFYDRLRSIIEKYPTKDLTILMGDFNAKVGTENTGYEDIMGRQGLGERNENDTNKLNKFKIALSNKFQAFHDLLNGEGTTMESNWKGIKEAITSTCHEVLGHKKHHHKEWITVDTLDKI
ncbi:unnamed protein product [Schistosoma margrebowiei]|uniref:Uncharacterized protein n=1 Tax=Schistosoma margrebowiei TaxID=48269 RepID=A0A183LKL5_9TREM|nr:unnamed protein product [Schistosoma margrebowiei]